MEKLGQIGLTKLPPSGNMRFYILVEKKSNTNIDGNNPQKATNIVVGPTDGNVWKPPAHINSFWKLFRVMLVLFFVFPARFQNIRESKNMDVQKIHKSMFVDFPNIVRLPKLHFATNTSFVLENKSH